MDALILAVDPGRDKCGLAVVTASGEVLTREVSPRPTVVPRIAQLWDEYGCTVLVLGDATTSRALAAELRAAMPHSTLHQVNEHGSTLEARGLYWKAHPPRGWRALMPLSMQVPPVPLDDFAAVILAHRYLATKREC